MSEEIKAKYSSTQPELYAICTLGWNFAKQHQADMVIKFPMYTLVYIDGKIADIQNVEEYPDEQARDLITETDQILLKQELGPAVDNWKFLERYIIHSLQSNKELIDTNLDAAGKHLYAASTREHPNWEDAKQMLIDGKNYLAENALALAPYMPVGFAAVYDGTNSAFVTKYNKFTLDTVEAPAATIQKITGNNNIYDALMLMLGDLALVIPAALKHQATFAYLKGVISSSGPAGLIGTVKDSVTNNPLEGALLRLITSDYQTVSIAGGAFDFGNIASGTYMIEISLAGYQTLLLPVTIATGVTSTKNYLLVPNP